MELNVIKQTKKKEEESHVRKVRAVRHPTRLSKAVVFLQMNKVEF